MGWVLTHQPENPQTSHPNGTGGSHEISPKAMASNCSNDKVANSQRLGGWIDFFFRELIEKVELTKGALKMACYSTNLLSYWFQAKNDDDAFWKRILFQMSGTES